MLRMPYRSLLISFRMLAFGIAALTAMPGLPLGAAEPEPYAVSIERLNPLETTGIEPAVANVLRNYYERNFTDADTWAAVESLRFDGTLHLGENALPYSAFKKKPDLYRIVLSTGPRHELVMAYDGRTVWQLNTRQSALAAPMISGEARNFIRDATTGGRLLYPGIPGKTIELVGTTLIDNRRAYELRTTLPDGQVIRSFLDMASFAEVQQITINNVTGKEELTRHSNFRMVEGIRIPFTSTLFVDGEQIHQSRIDEVRVNQGVISWMFDMPVAVSDASPKGPDAGETQDATGSNTILPEAPRSFFDIELNGE